MSKVKIASQELARDMKSMLMVISLTIPLLRKSLKDVRDKEKFGISR